MHSPPCPARGIALAALLSAATAAHADHPAVGFGAATSGPVTTISASPLPAGLRSIGLQVTHAKVDRLSDEALVGFASEHIHAHSTDSLTTVSLGLGFGVTPDLTIGARLPYVRRDGVRAGEHAHEGEVASNEVEALGDSGGVGDLSVIGKYRFFNDTASRQEAALLLGLEMPTGTTRRTTLDGERFDAEHQPGSGSWDPLIGAAYTRRATGWSFDASLLYKVATRGTQSTDLGDQVFYGAAVSWRLRGGEGAAPHAHAPGEDTPHHHHDEAAGTSVDLILELNGEWQARQDIAGVEDPNSGGHVLYLSPGVAVGSAGGWLAHLSAGIPVHQRLNGTHPETDWRVMLGVSRAF